MRKGVSADPTGGCLPKAFMYRRTRSCWKSAMAAVLGRELCLRAMPTCMIHVVDFHDVAQWLQPEKYDGRLNCHVISDNAGCSVFPMSILISAFRSGCSVTTTLTASRKLCVTSFLKMKLGGSCSASIRRLGKVGCLWVKERQCTEPPSVTCLTVFSL